MRAPDFKRSTILTEAKSSIGILKYSSRKYLSTSLGCYHYVCNESYVMQFFIGKESHLWLNHVTMLQDSQVRKDVWLMTEYTDFLIFL